MNKVFLGGTCNGSTWRDKLIPMLRMDYFNPVVKDWTPECQAKEEVEKLYECTHHLYVITPKMKGVFSIAEVVESAMQFYKDNRPGNCIFCIIPEDDNCKFDEAQLKSLDAVKTLVKKYRGVVCNNLEEIAQYLNIINN